MDTWMLYYLISGEIIQNYTVFYFSVVIEYVSYVKKNNTGKLNLGFYAINFLLYIFQIIITFLFYI